MQLTMFRSAVLTGAALLATPAWPQDHVFTQAIPASAERRGFVTISDFGGGMEAKSVAGAPYSADQITTTTQTLADGNRIVHTSNAKVYRDQQGRTRMEHSLGNIGSLAAAETHTFVTIHDSVAGVQYHLDPEHRTAQKMQGAAFSGSQGAVNLRFERTMVEKPGPGTVGALTFSTMPAMKYDVAGPASGKSNTEDLGAQTMEGIKVQGTRTTITIPAGAEGNEQPMTIVDERWYSPDLQTNLKTIHSDPRMGETVFSVTNLSRTNPDASLFQVPADYQVTQGLEFMKNVLPAPPPPNQ